MPRTTKEAPGARAIANRWTPALTKRGFTAVANAFLRHHARLQITATEAMLLIHIVSHKWDASSPFPAMSTLASRLGCGERNVRKMCARLEAFGYLRRVERPGITSLFELDGLFRKLEELEGDEAGNILPLQRAS